MSSNDAPVLRPEMHTPPALCKRREMSRRKTGLHFLTGHCRAALGFIKIPLRILTTRSEGWTHTGEEGIELPNSPYLLR